MCFKSHEIRSTTGQWCPSMFPAARALHWMSRQAEMCSFHMMHMLIRDDWASTMPLANLMKLIRDWDRVLKFWLLNEELLVSLRHQRKLNTSLLFVHTARRYYRWNKRATMNHGYQGELDVSWKFKLRLQAESSASFYLEEVKVVTRFP